MSNLTSIPGVGAATAQKLEHGGFQSVDDVATTTVELLVALTGFYDARATAIRDAARALAIHEPVTVVAGPPSPGKKNKKARKLEALATKLKKAARKAKKAGKKKKAKKAKKAWKKAARAAKKARTKG